MKAAGLPDEVLRLCQAQYGLASAAQLRERIGRTALEALVEGSALQRLERGVYSLAGSEPTFRRRAMAAVLLYGPPVAVSHLAAGVLWQMPLHARTVDVTVPRWRSSRRRGSATPRRLVLPDDDIVDRHGIPVTSAPRTVLDLAALSDPPVGPLADSLLTECVDHLIGRRLTTVAELRSGLASHPLHRGRMRLGGLLAGYGKGDGRSDGPWEVRVGRWLTRAGLPEPVRQHRVETSAGTAFLDMAYPAWMVALEFDGWEVHRGRGAFDRDRRRRNALAVLGWVVVVVTSRHSEAETVAILDRLLRSRGWDPAQQVPAGAVR